MEIIDFTHTIGENMTLFPGTEQPQLITASTCEAEGFRETCLHLYSHMGTHMDAPAHVIPDGKPLNDFPASHFTGTALVIDCTTCPPGSLIELSHLTAVQEMADAADFLLFHTGWSRYWKEEAYTGNYPCLSREVIQYALASHKKGIGLDTLGIDPVDDADLVRHHQLLGAGTCVIIENLTNLEKAGSRLFTFCALPLKFANADGAPVRAIGFIQS